MHESTPSIATLGKAVENLITVTATRLPPDVLAALQQSLKREAADSVARTQLTTILENAALAVRDKATLCQDTGTLTFFTRIPVGWNVNAVQRGIRAGVRAASRRGILRQNTIDTHSEKSVRDNLAADAPVIHWEPGRSRRFHLALIMKGGGCENMSAQYSLPDGRLKAGRDLEGVRRCVLDAVCAAQGHGCAPGILGVCIGGDRATGYAAAKRLFLQPLGERSADPRVAGLERRLLRDANTLGIGPMGLGGRTTLLDVKITAASRLPASYFVSVSYMCWALRRNAIRLDPAGVIDHWMFPPS